MVLLVCLPLPLTKALGYFALALQKLNEPAATLIGFASVLGYLAVFFPALFLFEPFALIASIWYTRQSASVAPLGRVLACWLALLVHTAVLITYLQLGR